MKWLTLILTLTIILAACNSIEQPQESLKYIPDQLCFDDQCYELEHAINEVERTTGLMNRVHLNQDRGMLFLFNEPTKSVFWMKDTLIPLDIIWMNQDFKVNYIANAEPCEELPCELYGSENIYSMYVLEIKGGEAQRIGLEVGDTLESR